MRSLRRITTFGDIWRTNFSAFSQSVTYHRSHLVSKASGQFIYASTVIKFIDDDDCNPREQLDIILKLRPVNSSSPYAQLDQLYIQILSQQPDVRLLRDIFVLIIAIGEPRFRYLSAVTNQQGEIAA